MVRTVLINSRSEHALIVARAITAFRAIGCAQGNGAPVATEDPQRAMWRAALARFKIRYRVPYNMRHTYASVTLSSVANPAFMARQLGHFLDEFFKTYAKWLDRTNNQFQKAGISKKGAITGPKAEGGGN